MKKLISIVLVFITIFSQTITSANAQKKKINIAALYWSMNIEGQVFMRKGVQKAFDKAKKKRPELNLIEYVAGDGTEGIEKQVKQMNDAIDKKVDLIIIQPTDNAALSNALIRANKAKIPVVAYDQYIAAGKLHSFITSNNYQAGYLNGEYISSLYDNNTIIKIVLIDYPIVSSPIERVNGFFDALKNAKQKYKVVANYQAVEPKSGLAAAKLILANFPVKNSIDVIFTINDGGGLPIVRELSKAGRKEIKIATIDGDPESIKNLKNNNLTVINTAQFCSELGRQSFITGMKILDGKKFDKKILVPTFPVTKQTIKNYHGWAADIPQSFKLPWTNRSWNNKFVTK